MFETGVLKTKAPSVANLSKVRTKSGPPNLPNMDIRKKSSGVLRTVHLKLGLQVTMQGLQIMLVSKS